MHKIASIDNIPTSLSPLVEDAVCAYSKAFGTKLKAVYVAGSWIRDQMRRDSDADFFGVLNYTINSHEQAEFKRLYDNMVLKWCPHRIASVDLKLVDVSQPNHYLTILRRVVMQVDGCLVYGTPLQGDVLRERSRIQIAEAFIRLFLEFIDTHDVHYKDWRLRNHNRRVVAKLVLRCMEWAAVINGAPISSDMDRYLADVQRLAPELTSAGYRCWDLYKKPSVTNEELDELSNLLRVTLGYLEELGVGIDPTLKSAAIDRLKTKSEHELTWQHKAING